MWVPRVEDAGKKDAVPEVKDAGTKDLGTKDGGCRKEGYMYQ